MSLAVDVCSRSVGACSLGSSGQASAAVLFEAPLSLELTAFGLGGRGGGDVRGSRGTEALEVLERRRRRDLRRLIDAAASR